MKNLKKHDMLQNGNFTNTEELQKLKSYRNWKVTHTENVKIYRLNIVIND